MNPDDSASPIYRIEILSYMRITIYQLLAIQALFKPTVRLRARTTGQE